MNIKPILERLFKLESHVGDELHVIRALLKEASYSVEEAPSSSEVPVIGAGPVVPVIQQKKSQKPQKMASMTPAPTLDLSPQDIPYAKDVVKTIIGAGGRQVIRSLTEALGGSDSAMRRRLKLMDEALPFLTAPIKGVSEAAKITDEKAARAWLLKMETVDTTSPIVFNGSRATQDELRTYGANVLREIMGNDGISITQLYTKLDMSRRSCLRVLRTFSEDGLTCSKGGGGHRPHQLSVTDRVAAEKWLQTAGAPVRQNPGSSYSVS